MPASKESIAEREQSWWSADYKIGALHSRHTAEFDAAWVPHTHAEYAFITCLAGRLEFIRDGKHYTLEPGDMLVHNPGEFHQSRYGADGLPSDTVSLIVNESMIRNLLLEMRPALSTQTERFMFLSKIHNTKAEQLVRELVKELDGLETGYKVVVQSLILQILIHLFRNCLDPTMAKTAAPLPRQLPAWESIAAMRYFNSHGEKDFSLSGICTMIGTSPSRFISLFRNSTALTPHVYFNRILIQRAQRLLGSGKYSVKEVAYELGFQTPSHFCKIFHSLVGTTPSRFHPRQGEGMDTDANPSPQILQDRFGRLPRQ